MKPLKPVNANTFLALLTIITSAYFRMHFGTGVFLSRDHSFGAYAKFSEKLTLLTL